jgi:iron complex outermembrane receptor protein
LEGQYGKTESDIFGNRTSGGFAAFAQADYNFEFPLKLIFGVRYDYTKVGYIDPESSVSPKVGLNYKLGSSTVLRGSYGKGFRAPTLAEAFTSTSASGILVKPNPELKSERAYSFELGVNHTFSRSFSLDLALFNNYYEDMIEPRIDSDGQVIFDNVTEARIQGFETNLVFSFLERKLLFDIGYTYLWARDIENDTFLKYRSRHNLVSKLNVYPGIFILGADFRFASKVEEIDWELVEFGLVKDGDTRVDIYVLDLRGGINMFTLGIPGRLFLNFNNILNYNYVEMIGNLSPIRNFSLSLELLL